MDDVLAKLEKIRHNFDKEEKRKNRLEGQRDAKMDTLKEMDISSIDEAKIVLASLLDEKKGLMKDMQNKVSKFEEKFPGLL